MAVPDFQTLMLPALTLLGRRSPQMSGEVREALAAELALTPADLAQMLPSGKQATFSNNTRFVCQFHERHDLAGQCVSQTERVRRQRRAAAFNGCIPSPSRTRVSRCSNRARSCADSMVRSAKSAIH